MGITKSKRPIYLKTWTKVKLLLVKSVTIKQGSGDLNWNGPWWVCQKFGWVGAPHLPGQECPPS